MKTQSEIDEVISKIIKFRDERDWEQFHNLKDLAIGLSIEASELMELFLWKNIDEIDKNLSDEVYFQNVKEELADIIIYCLLLSHKLGVNIDKIVSDKLEKNAFKYPVEFSKGNAKKYCDFNKTET